MPSPGSGREPGPDLTDLLPGPLPAPGETGTSASLPHPVEPGAILLGRYRLLSELGRGGTGLVFEALDEQLDRRVAVKVLHPQHAGDARLRELFHKESRLLARLGHAGIVPVHAFEEDPRCRVPVLVMELVAGKDLGRLRRDLCTELERDEGRAVPEPQDGRRLSDALGSLTPQDPRPPLAAGTWFKSAAQIAREIVRILEAAHEKGVIHRDLTPRNVLLGAGGWPVILDFGLGGILGGEPGQVTQGLHGTPGYLAPEQVGARRTGSDPRSDVYQVGLLLYELLTLSPAFCAAGEEVGGVLDAIRRGLFATPRARNRAVPRELEAICLRAMELDPERRYPSARDLGRDLDRWLDGLAPHAAGTRLPGRIVRSARYKARSHPLLVSGGAAALAVALLAVPVSMLLSARRPLVRIDGAWRYAPDAQQPTGARSGEPVRRGDWLGALVDCDVPAFVYGLTVVGGKTPPEQYMLPVLQPHSLKGYQAGEDARSLSEGDWCLRVPAGRTHVALVTAGTEAGEGLLVLAGVERMPAVETWFERLIKTHERDWPAFPGIPRDQAEGLFPRPGEEYERGEPLSALPPEERERQLAKLDPGSVLEGAGWDSALGARLEVWFPVLSDG